jgi:hypothetical protein
MRWLRIASISLCVIPASAKAEAPWFDECLALNLAPLEDNESRVNSALRYPLTPGARELYPFTARAADVAARIPEVIPQIQSCYAQVVERQRALLQQHNGYTFDIAFRLLQPVAHDFADCLRPSLTAAASSIQNESDVMSLEWKGQFPVCVRLERSAGGFEFTVLNPARPRPRDPMVYYRGCMRSFAWLSVPLCAGQPPCGLEIGFGRVFGHNRGDRWIQVRPLPLLVPPANDQ